LYDVPTSSTLNPISLHSLLALATRTTNLFWSIGREGGLLFGVLDILAHFRGKNVETQIPVSSDQRLLNVTRPIEPSLEGMHASQPCGSDRLLELALIFPI
jgi:hypothetical protein